MLNKIDIKNKIIKYKSESVNWRGFGYFYFPELKFSELGIPSSARAIQVKSVSFEMIWEYSATSPYGVSYREFKFPFELSKDDLYSLNLTLAKKNDGEFVFQGERWEVFSWSGGDKFKARFIFSDASYVKEKIGTVGGSNLSSENLNNLTVNVNMSIIYRDFN